MDFVWYAVGMAVGVMAGVGVGHGLVVEHGRKLLPLVILSTVALGLLLGWALDAFLAYVRSSGTVAT